MAGKWIVTLIATFTLMACATSSPEGPTREVVTVQFDANDYDQSEMRRAAISQCQAKGYAYAAPHNVQPNMNSGGWSYKAYSCY
ncbi:MAG: hypothetical protein AAF723_08120 [Pseudomonadota bacterium]